MTNQPTHVMTGIMHQRIYRGPLDGDTVVNSYQDLVDHITPNGKGGTISGKAFAGAIISVVDDVNAAYNAPYYISYTKSGVPGNITISYQAERILTEGEINSYNSYMHDEYTRCFYELAERPVYTKPEMTVQFKSAINGDLTTIKNVSTIYEDVEIGSYFRSGVQINWPERTSTQIGTRAASAQQDPTKIDNYLLGYSYGVQQNGITFLNNGSHSTAYSLNIVNNGSVTYVDTENEYVIYDNISIAYLRSSYMFYPQWYVAKRFEYSYGEGSTAWFGNGTYIPTTTKYVVTGKYRYYYGFTDKLPMNKADLENGDSALLNDTKFKDGTTTSIIVGAGENKRYFYVAFPSMYAMATYDKYGMRIPLQQPDGVIWDMISHRQNMYLKKMNITLGSNRGEDMYNVAFFDFEDAPIGNPAAVISFRVVPEDAIEAIFVISADDGTIICRDEDDMPSRTETSNNMIYDDKVFPL